MEARTLASGGRRKPSDLEPRPKLTVVSAEQLQQRDHRSALAPTARFHAYRGYFRGAQEVAESPYSVVVAPNEAHGPTSSAFGAGVEAAVATLENTFYVQVSSRVGEHMRGVLARVRCALFEINRRY